MRKRQKLGQHFLISKSVAKFIASTAELTKHDVVLEIGTGHGILLPYLCKKARKVVSVEFDKQLYLQNRSKFSKIPNLVLKNADGFESKDSFSVFVSNLPYSKSKEAIQWLIQKNFSRAIIMVQKEFAEKLQNKNQNGKAISVLINYAADLQSLMSVKKSNFRPQPKVDSVVLKLKRKRMVSKALIKTVNKLFSYKRKYLSNVLKQFGKNVQSNKRIEELTGDEIITIATSIIRK